MEKRNRIINEGGINGSGTGVVNVNSEDYKALQKAIIDHSKQRTPEQKTKTRLWSLRLQMETYVSCEKPKSFVEVGTYLKEHIKAIGVKNKNFANYIEIEESNLSAIITGRRKINTTLAYKLGEMFNLDPGLWLRIQNRNELLKLKKEGKTGNKKYELDDLLRLVA